MPRHLLGSLLSSGIYWELQDEGDVFNFTKMATTISLDQKILFLEIKESLPQLPSPMVHSSFHTMEGLSGGLEFFNFWVGGDLCCYDVINLTQDKVRNRISAGIRQVRMILCSYCNG